MNAAATMYPSTLTHDEAQRMAAAPGGGRGEAPHSDFTDLESGTHATLPSFSSSPSAKRTTNNNPFGTFLAALETVACTTLAGIDAVGNTLADWCGLTAPRYAEFIDEAVAEGQREQQYAIQQGRAAAGAGSTAVQPMASSAAAIKQPLMASAGGPAATWSSVGVGAAPASLVST
ncbi:hypothetical protein H9P43_008350 [Blastocladiella emersonii ATCC 22665]|nr:hypothetical protein H9P43_008350 [Blastocladiella emersonii ATCC 22665]